MTRKRSNYNSINYQSGSNSRNPHTDHPSRRILNKKKEREEKEEEFGEIPRRIAKVCGVKNLGRAKPESVYLVMRVLLLIDILSVITDDSFDKILSIISSIKKRKTKDKNRRERFKIIENNLIINYFGEDSLTDIKEKLDTAS